MNILAISGSIRAKSYNTALLRSMASVAPPDMQISLYTQLGGIPTFDPELNDEQMPEVVTGFWEKIKSSDGVIISTPEYAHGVPGALKNALDWVVNAGELVLKPVATMSVSTSGLGGIRSHSPLILTLSAMNWNVVIEASINVPYARNRFNENLELMDEITSKRIECSLLALKRAIYESR